MVNRTVEVPIDLDDINEDDLVKYLEDRGYLVEKEPSLCDDSDDDGDDDSGFVIDTGYNGQAKSVVRYINDNGEDTLLKEVLYEYLGMGHFNDVDTLCEELKKRLS
jgi:hypothetical protein